MNNDYLIYERDLCILFIYLFVNEKNIFRCYDESI